MPDVEFMQLLVMKKPKFNQLRGTYAHSLRHRICLGITACVVVAEVVFGFGLWKVHPNPDEKVLEKKFLYYFKIDPTKKDVFRGIPFDDS